MVPTNMWKIKILLKSDHKIVYIKFLRLEILFFATDVIFEYFQIADIQKCRIRYTNQCNRVEHMCMFLLKFNVGAQSYWCSYEDEMAKHCISILSFTLT